MINSCKWLLLCISYRNQLFNLQGSTSLRWVKLSPSLRRSVGTRSYSRPDLSHIFPHSDWIRRHTEYSVWMRKNAGKMRTIITTNTVTFYAVLVKPVNQYAASAWLSLYFSFRWVYRKEKERKAFGTYIAVCAQSSYYRELLNWRMYNTYIRFCVIFNPFQSSVTFLYPLKTSENQRFSDIFRGYRNVTLD